MEFLGHEEMRVLLLDTKHAVLANQLLYPGTVDSSVLRAAEIFRPVVTRKCPKVLIAHNHPSGDPEPSQEDIKVTENLQWI
jgi:DNA repair protein RadC